MKIQYLAVIFIIIILPISVILNGYTQSQVETLSLQISYDNKLNNATYDAVKAFQLNTINSDTSDLANSKLTDIEASASIFFKSIANNFNMAGYNQNALKEYVPALVYTMYDGYYIYSPYTNTLDDTNEVKENGTVVSKADATILSEDNQKAIYKQGDRISGLKPYISYSCRYKKGNDDFIITYSLDNYITIQGMIGGDWVYDYGYLLDNIEGPDNNITYRGVKINADESLTETIYDPEAGIPKTLPYIKINGVKYYKDNDGTWFSIMNEKKYKQPEKFKEQTNAGINFYRKAKDFTKKIRETYNLSDLSGSNAVDEVTGGTLYEKDENGNSTGILKFGNYPIFKYDSNISIEDPESNFNQQRLAVIRYAIEKNLSIAINNYNNYSGVTTNFQMPKLREDEWEKILNNVSVISFLQGLNIGGKIYNGYSIITNNITNEVVNEESIYMITNDNKYHKPNDSDLQNSSNINPIAYLNLDFEIKTVQTNSGNINFIPQRK